MPPSMRKAVKKNSLGRAKEKLAQAKASVRAKVEHCSHVVKCLIKHRKTRYRRLAKNNAQLFTLFGFANQSLVRRFLGRTHTPSCVRSVGNAQVMHENWGGLAFSRVDHVADFEVRVAISQSCEPAAKRDLLSSS